MFQYDRFSAHDVQFKVKAFRLRKYTSHDKFQCPLRGSLINKMTIILSYHVHIWAYLPYIAYIT